MTKRIAILLLITTAALLSQSGGNIQWTQIKSSDRSGTSKFDATNVVSLFLTCSGTQYLGADGSCHTTDHVNGVSYPASPSTHQVPVITASNTATYKTIPDCQDSGGNHLNFTQSSDSFSCGTSGGGISGTVPTSGWTARNGILYNDFNAPTLLGYYLIDNASLNWRLLTQNINANLGVTTSPYTFIATVRDSFPGAVNSRALGVYLTDGTKLIGFEILTQSGSLNQLRVEQMDNVNSDHATAHGPTSNLLVQSTFTLKIVNDGTHRTYFYWNAGAFTQFFQEASGTWLTETDLGVGGISITSSASWAAAGELIQWKLTTP